MGSLLQDTNAQLDKHENLSHLVVFPTAWTVESNIVTPTLKIKRPEIDRIYLPHLENWCGSSGRVIFTDHPNF